MAEVDDCLTYCPVCSEPYAEDGEHVSKLLPCTHSVCKNCLISKLHRQQENSLDCPTCSINHELFGGIEDIPDNPYITSAVKQRKRRSSLVKEQCSTNQRDLVLFCIGCEKLICHLCLKTEHENHDWDDLQQAETKMRGTLSQKIGSLKRTVESKKNLLLKVKDENDRNSKTCAKQMEVDRKQQVNRINELFDKLRTDINAQKVKVDADIDDAISKLNDSLVEIATIRENTGKKAEYLYLVEKLETVRTLEMQVKDALLKVQSCTYNEYVKVKSSRDTFKRHCGNLAQKNFQSLVGPPSDTVLPEVKKRRTEGPKTPQNLNKSQGPWSVTTAFSSIHQMSVHYDKVTVCGLPDERRDKSCRGWKLSQYSLTTDKELFSILKKNEEPDGMAVVTLADELCIAFAFENGGKIDFYCADDLSKVVTTSRFKNYNPSHLSTASGDTATLYCLGNKPWEAVGRIRLLDCRTIPPKAVAVKIPIAVHEAAVNDMCCVQDGNTLLFVTTGRKGGISAYNSETGEVKWVVNGMLRGMSQGLFACGVTTDGGGHVFVCDSDNACVHKFSANGKYMGASLTEKDGLGTPWKVAWCPWASSLVVAHKRRDCCCIGVFNVT